MHGPDVPYARHDQNLKLLTVFHYVLGGLVAFLSCFALIYLIMGIMVSSVPIPQGSDVPADVAKMMGTVSRFMSTLFILLGGVFFLLGETLAVLMIVTGRSLARRVRYNLAFAVACVECVFMPLGTILGIFTLVVLSDDRVIPLFDRSGERSSPQHARPAVQEQPSAGDGLDATGE